MPTVGSTLTTTAAFLLAYLRLNLLAGMEYRASFIAQVVGMFLNDGLWLAFWWLYFTRFPVVEGWRREDVMVLWAVLALSYGLAVGVFGNSRRLAGLIAQGQLDYYLVLPKNALLHALVSRMDYTAIGDALFGLAVFLALGPVRPGTAALFLVAALAGAAILAGFFVTVSSLAFFLGNAEGLAGQVHNAMIHFSTYPTSIFQGVVKIVLFTLIPAGFISSVPVYLIREFHPWFLAALVSVGAAAVALGWGAFQLGLRRYESGNLTMMRS